MEEIKEDVVNAQVDVVEEKPVEQFDKLSNREALERAIQEKREVKEDLTTKPVESKITNQEVKKAVEIDIEPPAEFSSEGKKAWAEKNIAAIQKEYRRIHDARTQEISRAQLAERQAKEEGKTYRELAKMAAPYIEARGQEGVTPEKAIMEALALINEFKKGDPSSVKSELKRIGIDLDKANSSEQPINKQLEDKIEALQKATEELLSEKEEQKFQKIAQTFEGIFSSLTSEKTRAGDSVYPDLLDNSEKGLAFARELGSLTQDARFQQGILRRFPDADLKVVVREAYKYLGGKVSGEPVIVSNNNQKHIEKSRRAAASAPSKVVARNDSSNLVGKLSNRAALARAYAEYKEH